MLPESVPGSALDELAFAAALANVTDPCPGAGVHAATDVVAVTTTVRDSLTAKSDGEKTHDSRFGGVTLHPGTAGTTDQLPPTSGSVSLSVTLCATPGP